MKVNLHVIGGVIFTTLVYGGSLSGSNLMHVRQICRVIVHCIAAKYTSIHTRRAYMLSN